MERERPRKTWERRAAVTQHLFLPFLSRSELIDALEKADANPQVSCIVMTGGEKAFAAGADIKEMASKNYIGNITLARPRNETHIYSSSDTSTQKNTWE
jgi:enoyl-CoA hydratase/carnithine racemase